MLLFRIRTRHVELWTDSSAMTSWLNLQPSALPVQCSCCPACAQGQWVTSPHVPLQPEASPVCYPWPQGPHRSSSFLPSPASVQMAAARLLGFITLSGEERLLSLIVHVLGMHRTLPGVVTADWESAKCPLHVPFRPAFALLQPSPPHSDCGSLAISSSLLRACQQSFSRIQEKLILFCLFWAVWRHLIHPCSECFAVSYNKIIALESSIMVSQMPKAETTGCCHSHL